MTYIHPIITHHAQDTGDCAIDLFNTDIELKHLLAVGNDTGIIDLINLETRTLISNFNNIHSSKVTSIKFLNIDNLISCERNMCLKTNIESSGRDILLNNCNIFQISYPFYGANIITSTDVGIYLLDQRYNGIKILNSNSISEVCLLEDNFTLFYTSSDVLHCLDLRRPENLINCDFNHNVISMSCNREYLAINGCDNHLYVTSLPYFPGCETDLFEYENSFHRRPAFFEGRIIIGDKFGTLFAFNPEDPELYFFDCNLKSTVVNIAANSNELAVTLEDDIYIFSNLISCDRSLVRVDEEIIEEEEETPEWLRQTPIQVEEGECSYERYGYCNQLVYVCKDCITERDPFGICEQCARTCHAGHDTYSIGVKRRFRCDCGNSVSRRPCSAMLNSKVQYNPRNQYNHNFFKRYCICDGEDYGDMVQCLCCSDWFHTHCICLFSDEKETFLDDFKFLKDWIFICNSCCNTKLTFIRDIPDGKIDETLYAVVQNVSSLNKFQMKEPSDNGLGFTIKGGRWLPPNGFDNYKENFEYKREFDDYKNIEEDNFIPKTEGQDEYISNMRQLITGLMLNAQNSGKSVIQASDVISGFSQHFPNRSIVRRSNNQGNDQRNN